MKNSSPVIGIDLGGTHARAGMVQEDSVTNVISVRIRASGSVEEVLQELYHLIDRLMNASVKAIGIGVPSVVDVEKGIVYDVQNIPSWREVALKEYMEGRYHIPVFVNNDANCFALGEKYFGKGRTVSSLVGLTMGTGLGAGIIINDKLYEGANCGAGEFGMVDYADQYFEYYASGQFFKNCYQTTGNEVFKAAQDGDEQAIAVLEKLGMHLGNAIKMILYTYDPALIIIGGSVSNAYPYFQKNMWERIHTFAYPKSLEHFRLEVSSLKNCGVLGAAALYYDKQNLLPD